MPSDVMPSRSPRRESANAGVNAQKAKFCVHNASELADHVPHPRCAWTWSEVGLSRRTLGYLRHAGLIEPVEDYAWRWQTSRELWRALPRYCDSPNPGTVAGQIRLDVPPEPTRTRIESPRPDAPRVEAQATFDGDAVAVREVNEAHSNDEEDAWKLGMVQDAAAGRAREVPEDQTTLSEVVREVGSTVETTYHPEVHPPASHPNQQTLTDAV